MDIIRCLFENFLFIVCVCTEHKKFKKRENVLQKNPEENICQILLKMAETGCKVEVRNSFQASLYFLTVR